MMQSKGLALLLSLGVLALALVGGCKTQTGTSTVSPAPAVAPLAATAAKLYSELTYPQSDDLGHYVGLPSGVVTVNGLVAALSPPTGVVVNGVTVQPYLVQDVAPFGTPAGYNTYAFSAPVTTTPTTLLSVALQSLGVTTPAVTYAPDSSATYTRLLELAGLAPKVPQAQYRLANVLVARKNYNEALAAYNRAVTLEPQFAWGYDGLGQTYVLLHRPTDAVLQFKKAKKLHPKWADSRYRLAQFYASQGRYDDAIVEYRDALAFAPQHPGLHRGYAVALYNRGHYQDAWHQVRMARKGGSKWSDDFEKRLSKRMPEPANDQGARKGDPKHKERGQARQDGARAPGPHALNQIDKHQQRPDGYRKLGHHASGEARKHSKAKRE